MRSVFSDHSQALLLRPVFQSKICIDDLVSSSIKGRLKELRSQLLREKPSIFFNFLLKSKINEFAYNRNGADPDPYKRFMEHSKLRLLTGRKFVELLQKGNQRGNSSRCSTFSSFHHGSSNGANYNKWLSNLQGDRGIQSGDTPMESHDFFAVNPPQVEARTTNPLPAPPALDEECESMDSTSNDGEQVPQKPDTLQCCYPVVIPAYIPQVLPFSVPFWPGLVAEPVTTETHEVLKPTTVHLKSPINVDELVGMLKLSLGESLETQNHFLSHSIYLKDPIGTQLSMLILLSLGVCVSTPAAT